MPVEPRVTLQLWISMILVIITVNLSIDKDIFIHVDARFTIWRPITLKLSKTLKGKKLPDCFDEQNTQMIIVTVINEDDVILWTMQSTSYRMN